MLEQKPRGFADCADGPVGDGRHVPYLCGANTQDSQGLSVLGSAVSGPEIGCLTCSYWLWFCKVPPMYANQQVQLASAAI